MSHALEAAVTLPRMKILGIALGTSALVATSTAAYACFPDGSTTSAPRTTEMSTAYDLDADTAGTAVQRRLAELAELVKAMQAKADALGTPATITPREAWRIKAALAFIGLLQSKLAGMTVTGGDAATVASLQSSLTTLASRLRSVLAGATVVAPVVKADTLKASFDPARADRLRFHHFCDHSGFTDYSGYHWYSGDFRHHHYDRYGDRHR
jgi:hypothetical protein